MNGVIITAIICGTLIVLRLISRDEVKTMTAEQWKKYKKHHDKNAFCPVCRKRIIEGEEGVSYIKTKAGNHIFIHDECIAKWSE